ncbi:MAG: histidine phosphatase family protein [Rhodovibrionaceae bacterium]|nr:histidine phosphatase family protein [Rhodovibrionaceae bacterium]
MIPLALLRHGPTDWNAAERIQGHTDVPLSEAGREAVAGWRLPKRVRGYTVYASPLARTCQTARLLDLPNVRLEPRLKEMNWGAWEGRRLQDLRLELGEDMRQRERQGFDFRPPGGESPRDLLERLTSWLREVADAGEPVLAITHKGVIRTLSAAASGWDLVGKPPYKIEPACLHFFRVADDAGLELERMNVPLERRDAA